jgi:cytochrome c553
MRQPSSMLVRLLANCTGLLLLILIMVSLFYLGKFLYFPASTRAVLSADSTIEKFTKTVARPRETGRFHISEETSYTDQGNAPMCLRCHGNFCHARSQEVRAFYNMHSFYLACETCHIRPKEGESFGFQWFDDKTSRAPTEIKGAQGSYGAKIVPLRGGSRLDIFPREALALEFMKLRDTYTEEQRKKIQEELMQHISKDAVTCTECHRPQGYLALSALGYSQGRIDQLFQLEVIKLIDEYTTFYLPAMFDPDAAGRKKEPRADD